MFDEAKYARKLAGIRFTLAAARRRRVRLSPGAFDFLWHEARLCRRVIGYYHGDAIWPARGAP